MVIRMTRSWVFSVFSMLALVAMQVYKARWNGVPVAVKALIGEDHAEAEAFQREIAVLEVLRHPHVVNYLATLVAEDGTVSINRRNIAKICKFASDRYMRQHTQSLYLAQSMSFTVLSSLLHD